MTEIQESTVIGEALVIIDRGLGDMIRRTIVSTDEVADLLLDVRMVLARADLDVAGFDGPASVAQDRSSGEIAVTTFPGSGTGAGSRFHGLGGFWHPTLGGRGGAV